MMESWRRFWFRPGSTLPLEACRILVGLALLFSYAGLSPWLLDLYGDGGWIPREVMRLDPQIPWNQSIFFYLHQPWQWPLFHCVFLFSCAAFALGLGTRWVKWIVFFGHLSYIKRNPWAVYGADQLAASILFILALAPIGRGSSAAPSSRASACTRLMQIQVTVIYLFSGLAKLRGEEWWCGDALWVVFHAFQFLNVAWVRWFAHHDWIVNLLSYGTLALEITYPFFVWRKPTRRYWVAAAIALHLGIALALRLYFFSALAIAGQLAFFPPERLGVILGSCRKRRVGLHE